MLTVVDAGIESKSTRRQPMFHSLRYVSRDAGCSQISIDDVTVGNNR